MGLGDPVGLTARMEKERRPNLGALSLGIELGCPLVSMTLTT